VAGRGWTAAESDGRRIFVVVFDDGWVESARQIPILRQSNVGMPLLMLLIMLAGFAPSAALGWLLLAIDAPYELLVVVPAVIAILALGVPMGWLHVRRFRSLVSCKPRWVDPDLADESMLTTGPPRPVRAATSAAELRPVVGLSRVVATADIGHVVVGQDGFDHLVTVTLLDGSVRTYRSADRVLPELLGRAADRGRVDRG
jgi:hypothetical protein